MDPDSLIKKIQKETNEGNKDNISRTKKYERFYFQYPEILWALLAALVSRNAGWNMCDLYSNVFTRILPEKYRFTLFLTYERANWLIFNDAYPQLLLYHYSTIYKEPMFHFLSNFGVSKFMELEWYRFWHTKDTKRLLFALIINEQNLIQKPVVSHPFYQKKIFQSFPYKWQERLHYSSVVFPTLDGELFGCVVKKFTDVDERIKLGKALAAILFYSGPYPRFINFVQTTEHTGSRYDYEKYFPESKKRTTPFLRMTYPIIRHDPPSGDSWDRMEKIKTGWFSEPKLKQPANMTILYKRKQKELELMALFEDWRKLMKNERDRRQE